jgi:hypothetical protein
LNEKMTRYKAASFHLLLSVLAGSTTFALLWFVWYPSPLLEALGGIFIVLILLGVDVTLGPLLTLIVFKQGKRTLKVDLSVIAFLQIVALAYGCYTLWLGRPVYVAALGHRFDVVTVNEVDPSDLTTAMQSLPIWGPKWVGTRRTTDPKERDRILFSALGGADYGHFPQHHQPIENMRDEILKNAQPISDLKKLNPGEEAAIDHWLAKHGVKADEVVFQGLKARAKDMAVIMDAKTAKMIGIAPFKPWP